MLIRAEGQDFIRSRDVPVLVYLNQEEKDLIANMGEQTKFACFPEGYSLEKRQAFVLGRDIPRNSSKSTMIFYTGENEVAAQDLFKTLMEESGHLYGLQHNRDIAYRRERFTQFLDGSTLALKVSDYSARGCCNKTVYIGTDIPETEVWSIIIPTLKGDGKAFYFDNQGRIFEQKDQFKIR